MYRGVGLSGGGGHHPGGGGGGHHPGGGGRWHGGGGYRVPRQVYGGSGWGPWYGDRLYFVEPDPVYFIQTRFGGQLATDATALTWGQARAVAAERASRSKASRPDDFIRVVTSTGEPACSYTAGPGGKWQGSCGDLTMSYAGLGAHSSGFGLGDSYADAESCVSAGGVWTGTSCDTTQETIDWAKKFWSNVTAAAAAAKSTTGGAGGTIGGTAGSTAPARTHCGQSGAAVKAWQGFLAAKGLNPGTADGVHGNQTEKASQQLEGKPQTGCVVSGGYTAQPKTPITTPPTLTPTKPPGTLMGMSKSAVYVGAGSLALLGVAIVVSRRKKKAA